ncbi:hypothetical protein BJY24_005445 [Nocardia transvalensis]|uniref:Uncharacterized protein n=1 Tax=Nocardia transvalensis TaxID=37333 RepID=A0A7W9UKG4_9NOCA|nr:hypothetical protein [Nocardia transvalensis]MBB5916533.1 hypothetical protein [Nocardia transvalensis]
MTGATRPTPWQAGRIAATPARRDPVAAGKRREWRVGREWRAPAVLSGHRGYVCAAAGSAFVLVALFQPWLTAVGWDGKVAVTAFGRITATTNFLNTFSKSAPPMAKVSGFWGILTAAVAVHTVCVVLVNLRVRMPKLFALTAISAVATAVSAILLLVYLNSKAPEVKGMVGLGDDVGGQIGLLLNTYFGHGPFPLPGRLKMSYATAALTPWSMAAAAVATGSAVVAVTQWLRHRTPPRTTCTCGA